LTVGVCACGRGRSLFAKSSAKTFLSGTAVHCVILGGEALASPPVRDTLDQKKASFLLPYVSRTWGILFASEKNPPEMTWIAHERAFFWGEMNKGLMPDLDVTPIPLLQKFFAELFFKKATAPRPQAHKTYRELSHTRQRAPLEKSGLFEEFYREIAEIFRNVLNVVRKNSIMNKTQC